MCGTAGRQWPARIDLIARLLEARLVTHALEPKMSPPVFLVHAELSHTRHSRRSASFIGVDLV